MEARGCGPDPYTYSGLIDGLGRSGFVEVAWKIFKELKELGKCVNVVVCNSMLTALVRTDRINDALECFHEMPQFGCSPDDWTYRSICFGLRNAGRMEDAYRIEQLQQLASPQRASTRTLMV